MNKKYQIYIFPLSWIAFFAVLQILGKSLFRYQNDIFSSAEIWRLLTAHWVHLNWTHWFLNSIGLLLLVAITHVRWKVSLWLKLIVLHSVFISLAFILFKPNLVWYVGFSGVLYGLYIVAAMHSFKKDKLIASLLMLFVIAKVASEQWFGSAVTSEALLGAPVVVDAHAFGLLCGLCSGYFLTIFKR